MSDYMENRTMLILYGFGICVFMLRIYGMYAGTWEETVSSPDFQKSIGIAQPLIELILVVSFIMVVIPRWLGKMKQTKPIEILTLVCSIGGLCLLVYMIPEFITDSSLGDKRMAVMGTICVSMVTIYCISYWYGKKYKTKKDNEEGVENNENDD